MKIIESSDNWFSVPAEMWWMNFCPNCGAQMDLE